MNQRLFVPSVPGIIALVLGFGGATAFAPLCESSALLARAEDNPKADRANEDRGAESEINLDLVADDELVGLVVDSAGKALEGVDVDVFLKKTRTDRQGRFRLQGLGIQGSKSKRKLQVQFTKQNFSPAMFWIQETGAAGWVIELTNKTYFEGQVKGSDGKPVANALVRANRGPKTIGGLTIKAIWTEIRSGPDGRYRLYVETDGYDIQVRHPGRGAARIQTGIQPDESKLLDIVLEKGLAFRANLVDSLSGEPVQGARIEVPQSPEIEGISDADGNVVIEDLFPGLFNFLIKSADHARWWSEDAANLSRRFETARLNQGWRTSFSALDFNLTSGMAPVTISVERMATVTGRVLDPSGDPLSGAMVSLTLTVPRPVQLWLSRFIAETDDAGRYELKLPASGAQKYNLVAHDGKNRQEWRQWANGVTDSIATKPGELLRDVDIRLTRPAVVRGRVLDAAGKPVANRLVRASPADKRESNHYEPVAASDGDGRFELKFIRPGEHFIQLDDAPLVKAQRVNLPVGGTVDGVEFELPPVDGKK
jgi:protocatechuate 3,4-dioxygenase beta subunit